MGEGEDPTQNCTESELRVRLQSNSTCLSSKYFFFFFFFFFFFLQTAPKRFLSCSSSLFVCRISKLYHCVLSLFDPKLFFFSDSRRLSFVIFPV